MVADQNSVRGEYKLARVSHVYSDDKGRVRQVNVLYKLPGSKHFTCVKRDVRKLVLILAIDELSER